MMKSLTKLLVLSLLVITTVTIVAQEDPKKEPAKSPSSSASGDLDPYALDPAAEYSTADRPEDNYLAKFHALEKVEKLQKTNLDKIFTLNIIVSNFEKDGLERVSYEGKEGEKKTVKKEKIELRKEYEDIYAGYKKAMDLYYRRMPIYAAVKLEENKKHINQFYQKISDAYRYRTLLMLNNCATNILELSLMASSASNPNSSRHLFNQILRLRVAYAQVDDAEEMRVKRQYHVSIYHYRIAKKYAISILEDTKPDEHIGKYQVHKADNKNRILEGATTATEVTDRKKDIEKDIEESKKPESF